MYGRFFDCDGLFCDVGIGVSYVGSGLYVGGGLCKGYSGWCGVCYFGIVGVRVGDVASFCFDGACSDVHYCG